MMKNDAIREKIKDWQEPSKMFATMGKESSLFVAPTDQAGEEFAYFFNLSLLDRSSGAWSDLRNNEEKLRHLLLSQHCVILMGYVAHAIPPGAGQGGSISWKMQRQFAYALESTANSLWYAPALKTWEVHRKARYKQVIGYTYFVMRVRRPASNWIVQ